MRSEPPPGRPVAVIGMAGRFAGAGDVTQFWTNLLDGVESVSRAGSDRGPAVRATASSCTRSAGSTTSTRSTRTTFGCRLPRPSPWTRSSGSCWRSRPRRWTTPATRASGTPWSACSSDAGRTCTIATSWRPPRPLAGRLGDVQVTLANEKDFLAPRLAFKLGFTGPVITVQTGCATSLTAVALACSALAGGLRHRAGWRREPASARRRWLHLPRGRNPLSRWALSAVRRPGVGHGAELGVASWCSGGTRTPGPTATTAAR